jgi:hypothetical protein
MTTRLRSPCLTTNAFQPPTLRETLNCIFNLSLQQILWQAVYAISTSKGIARQIRHPQPPASHHGASSDGGAASP